MGCGVVSSMSVMSTGGGAGAELETRGGTGIKARQGWGLRASFSAAARTEPEGLR